MYFNNILGQEFAKKYIINSIRNNKINHAYMFEGIDGIGKNLFAKELGNILINTNNAENNRVVEEDDQDDDILPNFLGN